VASLNCSGPAKARPDPKKNERRGYTVLRHTTPPPMDWQSGLSRLLQGLQKTVRGSFPSRLVQVFFAYQLIPQTTTGLSPSELLLGHRPQSRSYLLKPNTGDWADSQRATQVKHHNRHSHDGSFEIGDPVFSRNYHIGARNVFGDLRINMNQTSM